MKKVTITFTTELSNDSINGLLSEISETRLDKIGNGVDWKIQDLPFFDFNIN